MSQLLLLRHTRHFDLPKMALKHFCSFIREQQECVHFAYNNTSDSEQIKSLLRLLVTNPSHHNPSYQCLLVLSTETREVQLFVCLRGERESNQKCFQGNLECTLNIRVPQTSHGNITNFNSAVFNLP